MTAAFRVIIVPCFNLHKQCITMMHEFMCSVCWPVGGTLALLPIIRRSLTSVFTFYHTPHFLPSFCSVTLSLPSLPLCLICTNVLSHHCFSSDTHIHQTHTHTPAPKYKVLPTLPSFKFGGHPFSCIHSLFIFCPSSPCSFFFLQFTIPTLEMRHPVV